MGRDGGEKNAENDNRNIDLKYSTGHRLPTTKMIVMMGDESCSTKTVTIAF